LIHIIYDLEATCWLGKPPKGIIEIIEIGAVKLNQYGEILSHFNEYIRPVINPTLSGFCKSLTKIGQEQVDHAREFPDVIEHFIDWILEEDEDYLLSSWGEFDYRQIIKDCSLHNLESNWIENRHINLRNQYSNFTHTSKKLGLKNTVKREGFEFTGKNHNALSDAINLSKIFVKYIDDWIY